MIEVTDELEDVMVYGGSVRERLTAVLAIVERDYEVRQRAGSPASHAFKPHRDPNFGAAYGGGCGEWVPSARFGTVICGWPRAAHGTPS